MHSSKHYTIEEARDLIPSLEGWIRDLQDLSSRCHRLTAWARAMFEQGHDLGGERVKDALNDLQRWKAIKKQMAGLGLILVDLQKGQVDIPSLLGGREIYLAWEMGEQDITRWHESAGQYC